MTLSALIARVEEGTGPDRELDHAVMSVFYVEDERFIGARYVDNDEPALDRVWVDPASDKWVTTAPFEFTGSLDRVLSLIEQKLPGWSWSVHRDQAEEEGRQHWATIAEPWVHGTVIETAFLTSPARALLCACLHALEDSKAKLADATNGDRP